jgi:hypothetical protein
VDTTTREQDRRSTDRHSERRWISFALSVARKALAVLAPNGYVDDVNPKINVTAEKVTAEAAILLVAAARAADREPELHPHIDALAKRLKPMARNEAVRAHICNEPSVALDHACAHICLSAAGYPDPDYDRLIRAASESAANGFSRDRPAYHHLEHVWLRDLVYSGPSYCPQRLNRELVDSALGRQLDALTGTGQDAYALTHAAMFATDMGGKRIDLPRPADDISADLDAALAVCLDRHDYDIAAELLMCWPMLRLTWSPTAVFGYRLLSAVNAETGFMPTPLVDTRRYRALTEDHRDRYLLAVTYHTVLVMGLLGAVVTVANNQPREMPAGCGADEAVVLIPHLRSPAPKQWWTHYQNCTYAERQSLTPLLLNVALRRAVDARQLPRVDQLVGIADRLGVLSLPAVVQASDLLYRAAILALTDWGA